MSLKLKAVPLALAQVIASGAFSVMAVAPVMAQEAADQPVQRIEITGSSIKRAQTETALPVQTITHKDIEKLGVTSVEQLLQAVTANTAVGGNTVSEGVGAATYGESNASLRGLSANRTLVLVDGRRLAGYSTDTTGATDINQIPLSAVDHVEILKDGASSVYGSDAMAGVINFILRKNLQGVEVNGYAGTTKDGGGAITKAGVIAGWGDFEADRYNLTVSADVGKDSSIYGAQRSYAGTSWENSGFRDTSATPSGAIRTFDPNTTPNAGGVIPNSLNSQGHAIGNPLAPDNCAANGSAYDANLGTCRFNPSPFVPLVPEVKRANLAANFRFKLNDATEFYFEGFDSHQLTTTSEQPSPYSVSFLAPDLAFGPKNVYPAIIISPSSPYYPAAFIAANRPSALGQPVTTSYRAFDGGGREHQDVADQSHLVGGFRGTFKDWDYDVAYVHNSSGVAENTESGYQSQVALVSLLSNNNAFNPFTQYQSPALAAQIHATNYNGPMINSVLTTDALEGKVSGEVFKLPAGAVSVAVGGSLKDENLNLQPSAAYQSGDISGYGGQVLPLTASRHSNSLFAESVIPIIKNMEGTVAVRRDAYPNATSTNPLATLRYQPMTTMLFRGSYGTGFREPSMQELFTPQTYGTSTTFRDPVTGVNNQYNLLTGGNTNLKPENSEQASVGLVLDPIKGLSMSVDWWKIRVTDLVTTLAPQFLVDQAAAGNSAYTGLVSRDSAGNITQIVSTNLNAGGISTSGIDVDVKWTFFQSASLGNYGVHLNGTYLTKFDEKLPDGSIQHSIGATLVPGDPGGSVLNAVSAGGILNRWKDQLTLDWSHGPYAVSLINNLQSGYWDNSRADCSACNYTDAVHVGAFSTWDIAGSYTGIKNLTLRAGLKNMFNRQPTDVITLGNYFQTGYDPTWYDPHGQFGYVAASYKFQ